MTTQLKIRTDEFDRMTDAGVFDPERPRMELIGGQLFEMAPIGTAHMLVVTRLSMQLHTLLPQGRLLIQQPVRVPEFAEPQPDVVVLRAPLGNAKATLADCELVVEVSDSTLDFDRWVKLSAYMSGGAARVWIVNLRHGVLEEYVAPDYKLWRHFPGETHLDVSGISVDTLALFDSIPESD